jgi:hypothetical protein
MAGGILAGKGGQLADLELRHRRRTRGRTAATSAKPVRFSLDLDEAHHAFLKGFCRRVRTRVRRALVLRALLDELRKGPNLAARVRARISDAKRLATPSTGHS